MLLSRILRRAALGLALLGVVGTTTGCDKLVPVVVMAAGAAVAADALTDGEVLGLFKEEEAAEYATPAASVPGKVATPVPASYTEPLTAAIATPGQLILAEHADVGQVWMRMNGARPETHDGQPCYTIGMSRAHTGMDPYLICGDNRGYSVLTDPE